MMLTILTVTSATVSLALSEELHSDSDTTLFEEISWLYKKRKPRTRIAKFIYEYRLWVAKMRVKLRLATFAWPIIFFERL